MGRRPNGDHTGSSPDRTADSTVGAEAVIDILSDSYAHEFLNTLQDEPKTPRALAEASGASRPTVYRRLNRLQEAGLVADFHEIDSSGKQRRLFRATLDSLTLELEDGGFEASVTIRGAKSEPERESARTEH